MVIEFPGSYAREDKKKKRYAQSIFIKTNTFAVYCGTCDKMVTVTTYNSKYAADFTGARHDEYHRQLDKES